MLKTYGCFCCGVEGTRDAFIVQNARYLCRDAAQCEGRDNFLVTYICAASKKEMAGLETLAEMDRANGK